MGRCTSPTRRTRSPWPTASASSTTPAGSVRRPRSSGWARTPGWRASSTRWRAGSTAAWWPRSSTTSVPRSWAATSGHGHRWGPTASSSGTGSAAVAAASGPATEPSLRWASGSVEMRVRPTRLKTQRSARLDSTEREARLNGARGPTRPGARPDSTSSGERLDHAVRREPAGELAGELAAVAEQVVDRGEPGGQPADGVLSGHADAAVELDRLLPDVPSGLAHLELGAGCRLSLLLRRDVVVGQDHGGPADDAAGQLERGVHVGRAEGERLEAVERDAELLARREVRGRELERRVHGAEGLVCVGDLGLGDHGLGRLGGVAVGPF